VTGSLDLFGTPGEIGRQIKGQIRAELRLVASVGVAPNKFLAKVASDLGKPDGFVVVDPAGVQEFLDPLPVGRLWGVGRVSDRALNEMGVRTIGQLRRLPPNVLTDRFGAMGQQLWELAQGIDDRPVVPDHEAKSISHETTFPVDVCDAEVLRACLLDLTDQVSRRLRRHQLKGRTVHLKIRLADFRTLTRSRTLPAPSNVTDELWQAAIELLVERSPAGRTPVRLLGMGVSGLGGLEQAQQQLLFDQTQHDRGARLDSVTDAIRDRFGESAIRRAGSRDRK